MERGGWVYILTNRPYGVLYVGVTAHLSARIIEHREKVDPRSFTARYGLFRLVYTEGFDDITAAIDREKQLKAGSRARKIALIEQVNPEWVDLVGTIGED